MKNLMLDAARRYVNEYGFSVIPVTTNGTKKPLIPWERYQNEKATDDELKKWFGTYDPANIGIVTGEISNDCVVDIDEYNDSIPAYIPTHIYTPTVCTPRDGKHLHFSWPGFRVGNNQKKIPGVDFRGDGGYVVAPPSCNTNNTKYTWIIDPSQAPLAILPDGYMSLITETGTVNEKYTVAPEMAFNKGRRDDDLFHIAYCLAKGGMDEREIVIVMMNMAKVCNPPFPVGEVIQKVKSAVKRARRIDVSRELDEWISCQSGMFEVSDIYRDLQITDRDDRKLVSKKLISLVSDCVIERTGKTGRYRIVDERCEQIEWWDESDTPLDIQLPLGLSELTYVLPKNILCVAGYSNSGKGHPDGTKLLTPSGWRNIEEMKVGDGIYAQDGTVTTVTGVYPRGPQQCFEWTFNDRTSIITDFEHLWNVKTPYNKVKKNGRGNDNNRYGEYETLESYKILARVGGFGKFSHSMRFTIPSNEPIQYEFTNVPIDPYLLGVMLGDGCMSKCNCPITTADQEIIDSCKAAWKVGSIHKDKRRNLYNVSLLKIRPVLSELKLDGCRSWEKHIPDAYLRNSMENRLELLRGLLDTDGDISQNGLTISFTTVSERLCDDICFLVRSLGGKAVKTTRHTRYRQGGEYRKGRLSYRIFITMKRFCPFRLERKAVRYKPTIKSDEKRMASVKNAGVRNSTCISIAHESGLYIAQDFIVTHNTAFGLEFIRLNMYKYPGAVHYFNSEMGRAELRERLRRFRDTPRDDWRKFRAYERGDNFADVIHPEQINVIDYIEVNDEFWKVGAMIKEIHDKLTTGMCLIFLQKKEGAKYGVGAEFGIHKSRLYLNMEKGRSEIIKCKNFANPTIDPNGMVAFYSLKDGYKFDMLSPFKRRK